MTRELSVLFCTEGTYPFMGGGVSTWCDILCTELAEVDFTVYAVTGTPEVAYRYPVPPNVTSLIHIPLWGTQEPGEYVLRDVPFSDLYRRKDKTTESVIGSEFVPLLRRLLEGLEVEGTDVASYGTVVHELWRYFQRYDWNTTWKSEVAWRAFVDVVVRPFEERPGDAGAVDVPSLFDLTTAMRWLYNFLMPLNAPVPRTDVVHTTIAAFTGLAGVIAKHEHGSAFLVTDHGVFVRERYIAVSAADFTFFAKRFLLKLSSLVSKLNYLYADVVAPVANFNRRWEVPYGADPRKIETIYNGVDPELFVPRPKPAKAAGRPVAVAAARVFPLKDIETMIRAAALARDSLPDVQLVVYGSLDADVPYVERCRRLVDELDLEGTFSFGGFHSTPAEVYNEGDISVLSSISEGFPYTVLESMACSRPVVATDVGGVKEALEGFGIVVPPRDPDSLAAGMVTLLTDEDLRLELGRRAREQVLARYRTSTSVDAYRRLYRRLAGARREAGAAAEAVPKTRETV